MPDTDVIEQPAEPVEITEPGEPKPAPENPEAKAGVPDKEKPAVSAAELRKMSKRLEDLEGQVQAANEAAMHWHDQYKAAAGTGNGKARQPAADAEEPETDDEDLIDVITTRGKKGLVQTLRKAGFMTQEEFEARSDAKLRGAQRENTLRERYPELDDQESDMFKEAAKQYRLLEADGINGSARVQLAAERAELELRRKGTWKDPEDREERRSRAQAQSGGNGRTRGAGPDPNDKTLTPAQKRMAEIFEVSEDAYQKRAEQGIRFSGLRR